MSPGRKLAAGAALLGAWLGSPALVAAQSAEPAVAAGRDPALVVAAGSIARRQLVVVGRDLVVAGEALSDLAAIDGSIEVSGPVAGDVMVLGGDVHLLDGARVGGDVFVLGGELLAEPGALLAGRAVSYPSISRAWLTLLEGPSLGLPATSPLVLGAKLGLLAAWLAFCLLVFATCGREVLETARDVRREPFQSFVLGLTAVFSLALTALLLTSFAASLVGLPLLFLVVFVALVLKLWGMVAVFHALGDWLAGQTSRRMLPLHAATLGLVLLGLVKLLPWVGVWAWTVATFIGVGAALSSRLGRRQPAWA